jgi:hypothetical protein
MQTWTLRWAAEIYDHINLGTILGGHIITKLKNPSYNT